jgi:hypothetical protein
LASISVGVVTFLTYYLLKQKKKNINMEEIKKLQQDFTNHQQNFEIDELKRDCLEIFKFDWYQLKKISIKYQKN